MSSNTAIVHKDLTDKVRAEFPALEAYTDEQLNETARLFAASTYAILQQPEARLFAGMGQNAFIIYLAGALTVAILPRLINDGIVDPVAATAFVQQQQEAAKSGGIPAARDLWEGDE
jgi:hypothetical protein